MATHTAARTPGQAERHPTDASQVQKSDYSGVTDADLREISDALSNCPATLQVMAVYGRVDAELATRRRTNPNI
jgi:hypothetical protein